MKSRIQKRREKVYCIFDGTPCVHCDKCEYITVSNCPKKSHNWLSTIIIILLVIFLLFMFVKLLPYFIIGLSGVLMSDAGNDYGSVSRYSSNNYMQNQYSGSNNYRYGVISFLPTSSYDFLTIDKSI